MASVKGVSYSAKANKSSIGHPYPLRRYVVGVPYFPLLGQAREDLPHCFMACEIQKIFWGDDTPPTHSVNPGNCFINNIVVHTEIP